MFTVLIRRMRFSRENNLHRPPLIKQHRLDPIQVVENQSRSLVTGKAARESYRQSIRIKQRSHGDHLTRIDPVYRPPLPRFLTSKGQELPFEEQVNVPDLLVGNIHDPIPERNIIVAINPLWPEVPVKQET